MLYRICIAWTVTLIFQRMAGWIVVTATKSGIHPTHLGRINHELVDDVG